jgi:hypothetical protein
MSLSGRLVACLVTLFLAACATPPGDASPVPDNRVQALATRMPVSLLGFEQQEASASSDNPGTWVVRYRHPASGALAMVLLQPPPASPVPEGPDSDAVRGDLTGYTLALQALMGGGALTRVPDYAASPGHGTPPVLRCTDMRVVPPGQLVRRALICASGVGGAVMTVLLAARHDQAAMDAARRFLTAFALGLALELRQDGAPAVAPPAPPPGNGRIFFL